MDKGSYSCGWKDKEASSFRSNERVGNGRLLKPQVEEAKKRGKVIGVYADGSYDSKENFDYLKSNGIEPIIKVRKDSSTRARGSPIRAKKVRETKATKVGVISTSMDIDGEQKPSSLEGIWRNV